MSGPNRGRPPTWATLLFVPVVIVALPFIMVYVSICIVAQLMEDLWAAFKKQPPDGM